SSMGFFDKQCKIYFYLEDDTIQVEEPELKNSGIPQDKLSKSNRHRISLPAPKDDCFYNVHHFNINQEIAFYSRTFMITDCDPFTPDPYTTHRQEMEGNMKPLRPYERIDNLKQFLEHDRKVLGFCCYWDDTESMFGDPRELILHYFLADDTMEIYEFVLPNSGRDTVPKFLHRGKLPKQAPIPKRQPGEITDRRVLNVFGPVGQGERYILDSLKTGAVEEEFHKDRDLTIGGVINVWGRRVIICDCDNFTKEYYRSKYGIGELRQDSRERSSIYASPPSKPARQMPPYTGFGSEEDSLCSCQSLLLKPPQKDFRKLREKDRNSGTAILRFLKRGQVKKPGQELFKSEVFKYFTAQDLYVGARLDLNNQPIQLLNFPKANIDTIISKVKSISEEEKKVVKRFFTMNNPSNTGFIPYFIQVRSWPKYTNKRYITSYPIALIERYNHDQMIRAEAQIILKAFQLPLSDDLKKKDHAFLSAINWRENPTPAVLPDVTVKFDTDWRREAADPAVKTINYSLFLEDVFSSTTNINES
uniref:EF-hand domain (C-terminal) containing 2 n=1 Tax=Cyprinus carpio TaxID=7962 RepID=A0A8C2B8G9_CYPCA